MRITCLLVVLTAAVPALARGQETAAQPRVSVGGEATATVGPDDLGYFNYSDYAYSTLRLFSVSAGGAVRITSGLSVVGQVRVDNASDVHAAALYVRFRPWQQHDLNIQAGRIPPVFGLYSRRGYGGDNPLIGWPLAYQSLTTLRADRVPATAAALVSVRGRGWRLRYPTEPVTGPAPAFDPARANEYERGLPLVSSSRWDTGVEGRYAAGSLEFDAAFTVGSLSNPRVREDNGGKQVAARAAWRPLPGLALGLSAARGAFLSDAAVDLLGSTSPSSRFTQRAVGVDVEASAGHWLVRGEIIRSAWTLPSDDDPLLADPITARSSSVEGRYRLHPRFYVAARAEHIGFSRLPVAGFAEPLVTWDAPVSRVESGVGYSITRHLLAKASYQYNWRDADRPRRRGRYPAAQISWRF